MGHVLCGEITAELLCNIKMTNKNRSECICLLSKRILGLSRRSNKQRCVKKGVIDLRGFRCLFTGNVWRVENWAIYWGKAAQRSGAAKYQQILYYWHLMLGFQAYILKQNIFMTLKFDIIHRWWKISLVAHITSYSNIRSWRCRKLATFCCQLLRWLSIKLRQKCTLFLPIIVWWHGFIKIGHATCLVHHLPRSTKARCAGGVNDCCFLWIGCVSPPGTPPVVPPTPPSPTPHHGHCPHGHSPTGRRNKVLWRTVAPLFQQKSAAFARPAKKAQKTHRVKKEG